MVQMEGFIRSVELHNKETHGGESQLFLVVHPDITTVTSRFVDNEGGTVVEERPVAIEPFTIKVLGTEAPFEVGARVRISVEEA